MTLVEDSPDYVLVGDLGDGFTYARLNAAFRLLADGAQLLALQKNRYWRKEDGLSLDAGPFVAALEYASGKSATVVGKPERDFFRLALEDMGLEPHEVAMVGDDAEADVAGAQAAGLIGIQVRTGKYHPEDEAREADLVLTVSRSYPRPSGYRACPRLPRRPRTPHRPQRPRTLVLADPDVTRRRAWFLGILRDVYYPAILASGRMTLDTQDGRKLVFPASE